MKDDFTHAANSTLPEMPHSSEKMVFLVDVNEYLTMLDAPEYSEEEKAEWIQTMWRLIMTFVLEGFRFETFQEACGQPDSGAEILSQDGVSAVESHEQNHENEVAGGTPEGDPEVT